MKRRHLLATGLVATALLLTACSGDGDPAPTSGSASFNDADVEFATQMIPHHAQALHMVEMTERRDLDPDFAALTQAISDAQTPEIELMAGWLEDWDQEVPETNGMGHMDGGMHGSDGMGSGMMSDADLEGLERSRDDAFEDMWLAMMIEHHEGAIAMAETEIDEGESADAIRLAVSIRDSQRAEIQVMEQMLDD